MMEQKQADMTKKKREIGLSDFISAMKEMVAGKDKTIVLDWIASANFLANIDESEGSTLESKLYEIYMPLYYVKSNFTPEILQQVLEKETLGEEMIYTAVLLTEGYDSEEILEYSEEGALRNGYIPGWGEPNQGALAIIGFVGREDVLFIAENKDAELCMQCLKKAVAEGNAQGQSVENILGKPEVTGVSLKKITHPDLIFAIKHSFTETTAFASVTMYDAEQDRILQCQTKKLSERLKKALYCGEKFLREEILISSEQEPDISGPACLM